MKIRSFCAEALERSKNNRQTEADSRIIPLTIPELIFYFFNEVFCERLYA